MADEFDILEEEDESSINMTPLVNVALVLVLIFMVTSPFFVKILPMVKLPEAVTSQTEHQENISISISPEEGYAVNDIPITKSALAHELKSQMRRSRIKYVLIRADERIPHGDIEDVMRISKRVGVKKISFGTVPKIR